jgi:5'-3' exonuclease
MGIPSYFSHIIRTYSNIVRNLRFFKTQTAFRFNHLFMDCNSIVYEAVHTLDTQVNSGIISSDSDLDTFIINYVIRKIDEYISFIQPSTTIYIAFDGVAPFAKMEQQRTRRYKSHFISNIQFDPNVKTHTKFAWNTSAITPGTAFMDKLTTNINYYFKNSEKKYNVTKVITSCANDPGEGEHKLYHYIRSNHLMNDNIAVYGLDSDLIMLSIFHLDYCNNIYIFREAPEFLKNSIPIESRGDNDNEPHFLDIRLLSTSILSTMNCEFQSTERIHDYVFLCFLLGNDFLPHFPAMNIRTHGINVLLDMYRFYIGNHPDKFLVSRKTGKIYWKNLSLLINEISKKEHEFLMNEYFVRDKLDHRKFPETTPAEKEQVFINAPILYRQDEKYICPSENNWEDRYYKILFSTYRKPNTIKPICINYLEGLEWVFRYYTDSCPNWKWKYQHHYPPLFSDLCKYVPHFDTDFLSATVMPNSLRPFSPQVQLSYVLPYSKLDLLPKDIERFLKSNYSELYPEKYDFCWAFCRYLWEAHPILPEITVDLLEQWDKQFHFWNTDSGK